MLPSPTDPCHSNDLVMPSPALAAPAPSRAQSLELTRARPIALAGAVPLPGLEPWTSYGRLA